MISGELSQGALLPGTSEEPEAAAMGAQPSAEEDGPDFVPRDPLDRPAEGPDERMHGDSKRQREQGNQRRRESNRRTVGVIDFASHRALGSMSALHGSRINNKVFLEKVVQRGIRSGCVD